MCSLVEMKVFNMNVVEAASLLLAKREKQKWLQLQYFKFRYSENVIHWELEHIKC